MRTLTYYTVRDRTGWKPGPWDNEPSKKQWSDPATGLPCLAVRNYSGCWCGYVGVPPGHPWHGRDFGDVDVDCHGGLTYSALCQSEALPGQAICHIPDLGEPDHIWWLGFDCQHYLDRVPDPNHPASEECDYMTYRTLAYVEAECAKLARQIHDR